ncbi:hypothetical protein [Butyribacter intestini]|jgi:hypothetical protein|uniref:Uncharacterized protein n=1 Tax=Butyribacter intestini TaxID=1703332 RepID=A0AAW3JR04_9FIRM|nr:hypothetical protein [Butyribacter intestini]KQC85147.1 hypothetical protein APZ18_10625 [Butyribacter intestini]RHU74426.1 hypothetical protein DXC30_10750 [Butyribacter intestini]
MTDKDLFNAINDCDDSFIEETINDCDKKFIEKTANKYDEKFTEETTNEQTNNFNNKQKEINGSAITPGKNFRRNEKSDKPNNRPSFIKRCLPFTGLPLINAAAILILVLAVGFGAAAATSGKFHNWIFTAFSKQDIQKAELNTSAPDKISSDNGQSTASNPDNNIDIKADKNNHLSLGKNIDLVGDKESFIYKYHKNGDDEIVDEVYSIQDNGLSKLAIKTFSGTYYGSSFSFDYSVINKEIFAFNQTGTLDSVDYVMDGDTVYAYFSKVKGDTILKSSVAKLNLKTGIIDKFTDDNKICNTKMSPNGKMILFNYRAKGYWTALDTSTGKEIKIPGIDGYNHESQIKFIDDYHVLSLLVISTGNNAKTYSEQVCTNLIDLTTGKTLHTYKDYGEINVLWNYKYNEKNKSLKVYNITNKNSFTIPDMKSEDAAIADTNGNYVLFGDLEEPDTFCLCNLDTHKYIKFTIPKELRSDIEMYLSAVKSKMLITDGKDAYLVQCP